MKLSEFIQKHIKTKVDFDGAFGAQCVDLFRMYNKEVIEAPHTGSVVGAKDIVENYSSMPKEQEYYNLITDKTAYLPGDVVVWGATKTNKYGHVAIVIGKGTDKNSILVFEQDGFKQDGAKISERSIDTVIGYLRKKVKRAKKS